MSNDNVEVTSPAPATPAEALDDQAARSTQPSLSAGRIGHAWYATHVAVRLQDFFFENTPWQRRLWDAGTVSALKELLEASRWQHQNVLSVGTVTWLSRELQRIAGTDPGVGDADVRRALGSTLETSVPFDSRHWRRLEQLIVVIQSGYLQRWKDTFDTSTPPGAERIARAIAAILLDQGYSFRYLHAWIGRHIADQVDLAHLLDDAIRLDSAPSRTFDVLLPFEAMPNPKVAEAIENWLTGPQVKDWLDHRGGPPANRTLGRYAGAFRYEVSAKDAYAATNVVSSVLERLLARASHVPGYGNLKASGTVWIHDNSRSNPTTRISVFPIAGSHRGTYVRSLVRENKVHDVGLTATPFDDALELASGLNSSSPGPAITSGWSALESLLYSPGDPQDGKDGRGVVACDRAADLVACSWPRSELTSLTYSRAAPRIPDVRRQPPSGDGQDSTSPPVLLGQIASELTDAAGPLIDQWPVIDDAVFGSASSRQERCRILLSEYTEGRFVPRVDPADMASQERMLQLLTAPKATLEEVRRHVQHAFRRMYRYRNIVVHGGASSTPGLDSALRVVAPLVGAALDRIAHAQLVEGTPPLALAARAALSLELVESPNGPGLENLLS